jgi:hypothetical protein
LTCQDILEQYNLSRTTLDHIVKQSLLTAWVPESKNGRATYAVQEEDDFVLRCGAAHPHSFPSYRPPYLRFLLLRFLTHSSDGIILELKGRRVGGTSLTLPVIQQMRAALTSALPDEMSPMVNGSPPTNEVEANLLQVYLEITNLKTCYDFPESLDTFYFPSVEYGHTMCQLAMTGSSPEECADAAEVLSGRRFMDATGFTVFRFLFADFHICLDQSLRFYMRGCDPSTREQYGLARGVSADTFMVLSGAQEDMKKSMTVLGKTMTRAALAQMRIGTGEAISNSTKLASSAIRLYDAIGEGTATSNLKTKDGAPIPQASMTARRVAEYDYNRMFKDALPDDKTENLKAQ